MGVESDVATLAPHPEYADKRCLALISPGNLYRLDWLKANLPRVLPRVDCIAPRDIGHLNEVIRRSADTHRLLLTVGGDGTLNRVLNAANLAGQVLGLLPLGTGNDLARSIGMPRRPLAALRWLQSASARPTDVLRINGVLSHNSAGFGLDCDTLRVREASQGLAHRNYQVAFLNALRQFKPMELSIRSEERELSGSFMWVLAMNARFIGGGTLVAPAALLDDGLMDVVLFKRMPALQLLAYLPRVMAGTHGGLRGITHFRCRRLICSSERPTDYIAADGELYYQLQSKVEIECMPAAILLLR